ncbi:MAG: protein-L-isoaspartate O-methyltransferase [Acetobacteraceae bacterium]|nr:protein-L-isoaspartate O-methyltransferase [Acetobacteraceae bacterium]MSP30348.1 protein-L-isoaspartate O-methyltransferase [Acetobacteraceae bacterium]
MDQAVTQDATMQIAVDFADARKKMVDGQIRPNKVSNPAILAALRSLPRERFVPAAQAALAYADEPVPLGNGRVLAEPRAIAKLIQLCAPEVGARVLVVAAGTGYGAAVMAACGTLVTALEEDEALLDIARPALAALAPAVGIVDGRLAAGWSAGAPYDIILIEGAVDTVPPEIAAQLRPGSGRLVTVRAGRGLASQAMIAEMTPAGLSTRDAFDCAMPVLPSLRAAPGFVF